MSEVNSVFIGSASELGEFRAGSVGEWRGRVGATVVDGVGTLLVARLWFKGVRALARRDRLMERDAG